MYIERIIKNRVNELFSKFPVILITGPRQSGKTYFVKKNFSDYTYMSLEDLDIRNFARQDPRGFLEGVGERVILDEIQRAPELLSYIQTIVDAKRKNSIYVLTGSQQLELIQNISQSLAGRTAIIKLLPFSFDEIGGFINKNDPDELLIKGFYPRIYDHNINPQDFYSFYTTTYIERDIRQLIQINKLSSFEIFIKLIASRTAQILNLNSIGNDCGISHNTVKSWLGVLEASFIVYRLKPYYKNIKKRLIKSPKIHFIDPGLVSYLIGIREKRNILFHPLRGSIFETMVFSEVLKIIYNRGLNYDLSYYRDVSGREIDLIIETGEKIIAIEIKSAKTITGDFFKSFNNIEKILQKENIEKYIVYGGEKEFKFKDIKILNIFSIPKIFDSLK